MFNTFKTIDEILNFFIIFNIKLWLLFIFFLIIHILYIVFNITDYYVIIRIFLNLMFFPIFFYFFSKTIFRIFYFFSVISGKYTCK